MPSSDCKHPASVRAACGRKFISRGVRLGEGKVPDAAGLAVQGEEKAKLCVLLEKIIVCPMRQCYPLEVQSFAFLVFLFL